MKKQQKCYIYTRVSTSMQVEGYSLDAQKDKLYDEITDIENAMEEVETRLYNIRQDKISEDNVYQFLLFFDKLYDKFTDLEKKTFLKSFLSDVFIYEEEQKDVEILEFCI